MEEVWAYKKSWWYRGFILSKVDRIYTVYLPTRRIAIQTKRIQALKEQPSK